MSICFTCGRCCFGPREYVQVFEEDLPALGPALVERYTVLSGDKRFMRMEAGHCAALDCSNGEFRCSIYEQRPIVCRAYKFGGAQSLCPPVEEP